MSKAHRKWVTILAYFKEIPLDKGLIELIKFKLSRFGNVLIMIAKENPEDNPEFTPEEKFKAICDYFPEETKTGKIIISKVPDIIDIIKVEK